RALKEGARVFDRWLNLPEGERAALDRDAHRGQAIMRLLLARDLLREVAPAELGVVLRQALRDRPGLACRPLLGGALLRRGLGSRGVVALDRWVSRVISRYRMARFDYRYTRGR